MSDPVDPLAKTAYLGATGMKTAHGMGRGCGPSRSFGLGVVMNARAAYFAKRDSRFASFLTEGPPSVPTAPD